MPRVEQRIILGLDERAAVSIRIHTIPEVHVCSKSAQIHCCCGGQSIDYITSCSSSYLVQPHGHRADKRLDARRALVVGGAESPADVFVVQHLHLERKVLLEVLEDHHQEGELDPQSLACVGGARDERGRHVCAHDLEDGRLNVLIRDALDVPVAHLLVPYLQWLRPVSFVGVGVGRGVCGCACSILRSGETEDHDRAYGT